MIMKYLIIGLGNFGKTLAEELTALGHEIIGVDVNEHRIEEIKDRISISYIMDATEKLALKALPLDDIDCAIVAIGQSMDSSLRVVASLKELSTKTIYARALDQTHRSILRAMNIQRIFIPECYAARIFADKITDKQFDEMT